MLSEQSDRKYARFLPPTSGLPEATASHYAGGRVIIKCTPRPGGVRFR